MRPERLEGGGAKASRGEAKQRGGEAQRVRIDFSHISLSVQRLRVLYRFVEDLADFCREMSTDLPTTAPVDEPKDIKLEQNEQNLVVSFIQFIRQKVSNNHCNEAQIEALEVGIQCLESAFNLNDSHYAFQPSRPLIDIFNQAEGQHANEDVSKAAPTEADIAQANKLKEDGNTLMKDSKFELAVQKYNEAIKLNRDPVYFCNRAAAYCRMEQYDLAIQDCRTALALDPNYSKAYGRMGLALSCQNRYEQAVEAYKKALELDPTQDSYKNNLKIAEDKVRELNEARGPNPFASMFGPGGPGGPGAAGLPGMMGGMGGMPDLGSMLNNPAMMNMAQTLMNDPNIQNMMSQLMTEGGGLGNFLAAGQQLAQQVQQSNPEFVEQLRRQFEAQNTGEGQDEQGQGNGEGDQNQPRDPSAGGAQ
ncbi:hypothetical protein WR25_03523 [Diploscapter pachys]|uniref:SGTA homodimerisation domain-containing protein n=1 Tax=Diploscapter pachys TaxID=2018661 RepID=A0A2A2JC96_9BILA|nr:hypothetical protein WR25_03523 [Diploscapter pachys]